MIRVAGAKISDSFSREKDKLRALIFGEIFSIPETTRKSLIDNHQLRSSSVSAATNDLLKIGLVSMGGKKAQTKPGRPEYILIPQKNRLLVFSSYVEGRRIKASLVNLAEEHIVTDEIHIPADADNAFFSRGFTGLLSSLLSKAPKESQVIGAAVAMLGAVDSVAKVWLSSTRWPHIKRLDFARIGEAAGIEITLKRSIDSELEFILTKQPEYRSHNVLLFNWGLGVGASYAQKGGILSSRFGRFADIGRTRLSDGRSIQTLVSLEEIIRHTARPVTDYHEDESLYNDIIRQNELAADPFVSERIDHVATALTNLFMILYPDVILFLGPLMENEGIYSELTRRFGEGIGAATYNEINTQLIPNSFGGASLGNVYSLFQKGLSELLLSA